MLLRLGLFGDQVKKVIYCFYICELVSGVNYE